MKWYQATVSGTIDVKKTVTFEAQDEDDAWRIVEAEAEEWLLDTDPSGYPEVDCITLAEYLPES